MSTLAVGQLFYRRRASPLHAVRAGVGAVWALALIAAVVILFDPIVLGALLLAVLGAGAGAGVGRQLAKTLRLSVIVALPIVFINVLVTRQGLTVFARLGDLGPFGQGDLTLEAVVYGAVIALKVTLLMLTTTLASLAVDPDELLRGFRRLSFRSALTLALAMRMVPLLGADARRLADAQRTRPGAGTQGVRARVALVSALVAGSLDRASEVAATLELRGFAQAADPAVRRRGWLVRGRHARRSVRRPWSRHDFAFACSALATLALVIAGRASGAVSFVAYPLLKMSSAPDTLVLCVVLCAAVLMPFLDRRGVEP
ncbi:MAG TPA: energy-coupling factor transporter transmembrane component T [Solirubrobacteraceae bacterium]|jgi:energy-coupling factor transport system permease protein|nr:energy-coupling factor transporter transmembrane component T [Solirubrobacteraceae bacterium]